MRKFYVTLNQATRDYTDSSMYEAVYADDVAVGYAGQLEFCTDTGMVAIVYAPGTWVLFTEDQLTENKSPE